MAFEGYLAQMLLISSCGTYTMPKESVLSLYGKKTGVIQAFIQY